MGIITSHEVSLYGGSDERIVLRPLTDEHLPLLYRWNADPEVLYWTEGGRAEERLSYSPETVREIYGGVSRDALCFLVEVDDRPVGECWLQRMNLENIRAMYPQGTDVRRIDMCIGEKDWWNRGIGTRMIDMLIGYAFHGEHVDVLHCFCEDYNRRSRRVWEKNGFSLILSEPLPPGQKGTLQLHFRLTRAQYLEKRRFLPARERIFMLPLEDLQPSQLYVSAGKMRNVREWMDAAGSSEMDPIPVKRFQGRWLMTDGHTRAAAACLAGWEQVPVYLDEEQLDMAAYAKDVEWCEEEGVLSPAALTARIVSHADYERLWRKRCQEMT